MNLNRHALSRVLAVANGKGGAGKTSLAVNLAGLSAAAGWSTLLIDLDPQGNAGHDLGYGWDDTSDQGQHLVDVLLTGRDLHPVIKGCRPNLDIISGGVVLDDVEAIVASRTRRDGAGVHQLLARALEPLAESYDLVVIDTPPTRPLLLQQALTAATWIVVPTRADRSSIEGLRSLAHEITRVRDDNPTLGILGAVLFDVSTSATVVRRNALEDIANALDGAAPVLDTVIRHSESAAVESREKGLLAHELAERVENAEPYWKALQAGRTPDRVLGSAGALAEDYVLLVQSILTRLADHEATQNLVEPVREEVTI